MSSLITKNFRIAAAKAFQKEIVSNTANIYFFMGKPTPWQNEESAPQIKDDPQEFAEVYDNIIAAKKVGILDVKNVVKRINWIKNTVYAEYDDQDDLLFEKPFYVLNSEFNVYKCISNNNGSPSLIEPTGTSLRIFTTSDNYKWKFLYSINLIDQLKFLTRSWMPVSTDELVKSFAIDGGIEEIKIYSGGIDYSSRTKFVITGDQEVSANIDARVRLGTIIDYQINNPGKSYRSGKLTYFQQGPGRFANVRPIISPVGGHGSDPIKELGSSYLMFYSKIENNEGEGIFFEDISFRQIGLLSNPKFDNTRTASNNFLSFVDNLTLNNISGVFLKDEYLIGNTSKSNLYCIFPNTLISSNSITISTVQSDKVTNNFILPIVGETIIGVKSGATGLVSNFIKSGVEDDIGEILYVENFSPIQRNKDQSETLHLVIEF